MSIKDRFLAALGIRPRIPDPIVKNDPGRDPDELATAATRTDDALHRPAQPAGPGRPLRGIVTDDLVDFLLPADYLERRAAREAEHKLKPQEFYVLPDIKPR